jgi:dTDP-glucose pyrophosphorylase
MVKALILAGGRGKRLGDTTKCTNKCLLVLNNRPVIEYNLDRAVETGADEIIIVVGHCAEEIINRYGISYQGIRIRYVIQWEQRGLVHAIESCRHALAGENFALLLGDEVLVHSRMPAMLEAFVRDQPFALCGVLHQPDHRKIGKTYTVLAGEDGRIFRLIEKPKTITTDIQGTGHCIFTNGILTYIDRTPIHPERGERELPDLIQCAVDDGKVVRYFNICDKYTNINEKEDLAEAATLL